MFSEPNASNPLAAKDGANQLKEVWPSPESVVNGIRIAKLCDRNLFEAGVDIAKPKKNNLWLELDILFRLHVVECRNTSIVE